MTERWTFRNENSSKQQYLLTVQNVLIQRCIDSLLSTGANDCKLVTNPPCGGRPAQTPEVMFM